METLPLSTVKSRFSELVDRVARQQDRVLVTRHGRPAVVLISPDDLESLEETLDVMSDPELMAQIREGQEDLARGEAVTLEELEAEFKARHKKQQLA